jgi:hypothetical protein
VKGISNYLIYTVQRDFKAFNHKPINILEEEDELAYIGEDDDGNQLEDSDGKAESR